jgi:hypothetical protein
MHLLSLAGESRLAGSDEFNDERVLVNRLWQQHLGELQEGAASNSA